MILRDTHLALEKRMKELDKQKKRLQLKYVKLLATAILKKTVNIMLLGKSRASLFVKRKLYKRTHRFK